jgi:hypothetical protein
VFDFVYYRLEGNLQCNIESDKIYSSTNIVLFLHGGSAVPNFTDIFMREPEKPLIGSLADSSLTDKSINQDPFETKWGG